MYMVGSIYANKLTKFACFVRCETVKLRVMCETERIYCVFASGLMCINHTRRLNASLTLPEENKFVFFSTSKFLKKNLLITPKFSSAYTDGGKTNNIRSHYKKATAPHQLI